MTKHEDEESERIAREIIADTFPVKGKDYQEMPASPEAILKAIGAQIVLGEWRFPFYGEYGVAEMLPFKEWTERRRRVGHEYVRLLKAAKGAAETIREEWNSVPSDLAEAIKNAVPMP